MTKDELIEALKEINKNYHNDEECDHVKADDLLLKYIDDEKVSEAFHDIAKWYA